MVRIAAVSVMVIEAVVETAFRLVYTLSMKSLTDIVNGVKSTVSNTLKHGKRALLVPIMALGMYAGSADAAPVQVTFAPDQTGTVSAPVVGLGGTSSDYLLTERTVWSTLDKNFDGNNQEIPQYANTSYSKDAASFDDEHMLQLGEDNNLRKINLSTGMLTGYNGHPSIHLGLNVFGIGYDATLNKAGFGRFDGNTLSFHAYDFATDTFEDLGTLAFDSTQYGTPTGLDFVNVHGTLKMLVGTRDAPGQLFFQKDNYILDINALKGTIDQYAKFDGSFNKLEDVLYDNGRLATSYQVGGNGFVQVGDFTPIPEPATIMLLGGDGQAVINYRVLNNTDSYSQSSAISAIYLKADGVVSVWICDETYPGWNAEPVDRSAGLDIDGSGFYDRGVALYSTDSGYDLMPGASLDFQIQSFYSHNLQDTSALLIKAGGGEDAPFRPLAKTAVCDQPADLNRDGVIDLADLAALAAYWLGPRAALYGGPVPDGLADDGVVNLEDWAALARYWPGGIEND